MNKQTALELPRREWVYVDSPNDLGFGECPRCGGKNYCWSNYCGRVWCFDCCDDVRPTHYGIIDCHVSIECCKMMGFTFAAVDVMLGTLIEFDDPRWPNKIF